MLKNLITFGTPSYSLKFLYPLWVKVTYTLLGILGLGVPASAMEHLTSTLTSDAKSQLAIYLAQIILYWVFKQCYVHTNLLPRDSTVYNEKLL